jgi:RNA polymerase sigma-70 factor, ECF subfamily
VIDREEHESGRHLNLHQPLRNVRETSSLRRSEQLSRCNLREGSQPSQSFLLLEEAMSLGTGRGHPQLTIDLSEYVDGLYSYALVLSRNRTEAEDLVQETCLRALRAMGRLRPDSNAKSWLFTILRNIWFNQLRQRRTAPEMVELDLDSNGPNKAADTAKDPHATYVSNIEQEQVRAAILQLSPEFREIIILREYEELSYQEIAAVLDCPLGTVMSRLARARSKLRELLTPIPLSRPPQTTATSGAEETGT